MAKQYRNKHNDRVITIIDSEMTDSGSMLYKCRDEDTRELDYTGDFSLKQHWVEIVPPSDEEVESLRESLDARLLQDAEFIVQSFTQADRIVHIANLYAALDYERKKSNDACDTHSQTLITSDEEEEI